MKLWIALMAVPLLAHDVYMMPQRFEVKRGEKLVVAVQVGDSFPVSEGPMDPARIVQPQGEKLQQLRIFGRSTFGIAEVTGNGYQMLGLASKPNRIELAAEKFETYLKDEGLDWVIEYRKKHGEAAKPGRELYQKNAKTMLMSGAADEGYKAVTGVEMEFVLERDPSQLGKGERLPVRLMQRGKPVANAQVKLSWAVGPQAGEQIAGRTDASGRIAVSIDKAAKWRLHSVMMERAKQGGDVDWESTWTSLTFETSRW